MPLELFYAQFIHYVYVDVYKRQPKWYLILSRYPQEYPTLLQQYKLENKLTFADRIERVGTLLQMLDMLL